MHDAIFDGATWDTSSYVQGKRTFATPLVGADGQVHKVEVTDASLGHSNPQGNYPGCSIDQAHSGAGAFLDSDALHVAYQIDAPTLDGDNALAIMRAPLASLVSCTPEDFERNTIQFGTRTACSAI